jgi:F-type H+-transporting ATPase subunit epsilon
VAAFQFELVAPDKLAFRGPAESVLVPGVDGDFLVLKDHAAVMTSLRPGVLDIEETAGKHSRFFVRGGFADVNPAGLIVLAETALPAQDLSGEHISQEIKNAEEDLADASDEGKRAAREKLDRLRELKESMKL